MSSAQKGPGAIAPHVPPRIAALLAAGEPRADVFVAGWVRSRRSGKNVGFVALNDGSSAASLQLVVDFTGPDGPALSALLALVHTGACLKAHGELVLSSGKGQSLELKVRALELLGEASATDYPLQKKGHTLEFLRSRPELRGRSNTFGAVFRLRSRLAQATHAFFAAHDFYYVQTPIITTSDCEGAGEMFEVTSKSRAPLPFFGRPAYLTVSGQLAGESLAYALGRIYTFGPTFRAENSNTARHLAEFWMIEPEMAFFNLAANRALAGAYLQACVAAALAHQADDLAFLEAHYEPNLGATLRRIVAAPAETLTYSEAIHILQRAKSQFGQAVSWGIDLQAEHERYLTEQHCAGPVFVTDYPKAIKAFYMYENDDEKTVAAMDLLVPRLGELIGGSQREHRPDRLRARLADNLRQQGVADVDGALAGYAWYLDQNRWGGAPHAGFGLGFERLVMLVTGMANIRDVIPFPRAPDLAPG